MLKRAGRREEAVDIWRVMVEHQEAMDVFPFVELAKHHEWHILDLEAALAITTRAIEQVSGWRWLSRREEARRELEHRLNRLHRKLAGQAPNESDAERED